MTDAVTPPGLPRPISSATSRVDVKRIPEMAKVAAIEPTDSTSVSRPMPAEPIFATSHTCHAIDTQRSESVVPVSRAVLKMRDFFLSIYPLRLYRQYMNMPGVLA